MNRHANNVAYAAWAVEAVPPEVVENHHLTEIEIAYRSEVFYGESVLSRSRIIPGKDGITCLHQLVRGSDSGELTRLVTRWRKVKT